MRNFNEPCMRICEITGKHEHGSQGHATESTAIEENCFEESNRKKVNQSFSKTLE